MSNVSAASPEFDFWEFVGCARCQLPFFSQSGATIPFWLTECGHVVCNNHLNADQSCSVCSAPGIQLVPLQQEMDPPMSDWFRSIPYSLDAIAYAAKFQQESMAAQIRYYKSRHQQHRAYIEKLKHEIVELRRSNQYFNEGMGSDQQQQQQQQQYQQQPQAPERPHHHNMNRRRDVQEPSASMNVNGKRPMEQQQPMTASSPHSAFTPPVGPGRLTLPPGQQPQNLAPQRAPELDPNQQRTRQQRPGSRSFQQQYAYVPPSTPRMPPPQVSHMQSRHQLQRTNALQPSNGTTMPPPPAPASKFKPAQSTGNRDQNRNMGPPPTPQVTVQRQSTNTASAPSSRFLPPSERFAAPATPMNKSGGAGRFVPPVPNGAAQRFVGRTNSMAPAGSSRPRETQRSSTAVPGTSAGGGQRVPFVPNGFG